MAWGSAEAEASRRSTPKSRRARVAARRSSAIFPPSRMATSVSGLNQRSTFLLMKFRPTMKRMRLGTMPTMNRVSTMRVRSREPRIPLLRSK